MRAPRPRRALFLVFLACAWLSATPFAQDTPTQPPAGISGLPPETIATIIAGARPDTPATLAVANRDIVVLRAMLLGRSSTDRVSSVHRLIEQATEPGRPVQAGSHAVGEATVITLDGRDTFAIVPADVDELVGETLQSKTESTVSRLQQALDETIDARRPEVLFWAVLQSLAATLALFVIVWLLRRLRLRAVATAARATER